MRILAHTDFDGLASAVLAAMATGAREVEFCRPDKVEESAREGDIVVDLPYTPKAAVWLDHHGSQREAARGARFEGELDPGAACAAEVVARFYGLSGPRVEEVLRLARLTDQFRLDDPPSLQMVFALEYRQDRAFRRHLFRVILDEGLGAAFADARFLDRLRRFAEEKERPTLELVESGERVRVLGGRVAVIDVPDRRRYSSKVAELALYGRGLEVVVTVSTHPDGTGRLSFGTNPALTVPFDCARVARAFGGGGHSFAAGASFDSARRAETVERLVSLVRGECERQGRPL